MSRRMRPSPSAMRAASASPGRIRAAVSRLKAKVVVEQTHGSFNFQAKSLPHRQTESATRRSGRHASSSRHTGASMARVISVSNPTMEAKSRPTRRSRSGGGGGMNASHRRASAPAASSFSRKGAKV